MLTIPHEQKCLPPLRTINYSNSSGLICEPVWWFSETVSRFTDAKCDRCIMVACSILGSLEFIKEVSVFSSRLYYVWLCALQLLHSAIYVSVNWMSHRGEAEVPFNICKFCYDFFFWKNEDMFWTLVSSIALPPLY